MVVGKIGGNLGLRSLRVRLSSEVDGHAVRPNSHPPIICYILRRNMQVGVLQKKYLVARLLRFAICTWAVRAASSQLVV